MKNEEMKITTRKSISKAIAGMLLIIYMIFLSLASTVAGTVQINPTNNE